MPRKDRTGPQGQGPRTGGGRGRCNATSGAPVAQGQDSMGSGRPAGQGQGRKAGRVAGRGRMKGGRRGR